MLSYRSFLFETQAHFLDIAQQEQVRDFIGFLGVGIEPTLDLVVKHLLACAKANREVNQQVYSFLNGHVDNPEIRRLQNEKCLLLEGGRYVRPNQVFWGEHRFGRYRFRLNQDLRVYTKLFNRLGVRESPEVSDAIQVLLEISDEFGAANQPLDEQAYGVLLQCWVLLSRSLEQGLIAVKDLETLHPHKVIPDDRRVLNLPERIFFEDRPGLAVKFGDFLQHNAIRRPEDAWLAMEAVGVRPLSKAVYTKLVECSDAILAESVMTRIRERRDLIARVVAPHRVGTEGSRSLELLDRLRVERTSHLEVNYTIKVFGQLQTTTPEAVSAYYDTDGEVLYFQQRDVLPWPAIARELAYALDPKAEAGQIAPGLKEVLSTDSFAEANTNLDELGYSPLEALATSPVPVGGASGTRWE